MSLDELAELGAKLKECVGIFGDSCGCSVRLFGDGSIEGTGHMRDEADEEARKHVNSTLMRLMKEAIRVRNAMDREKR